MKLFESRATSSDALFNMLQDPKFAEKRGFLEELYQQFEPYADQNFVPEFRQHCLSRFWEMYLGCALLNAGFELLPRKNRENGGPDICIKQKDTRVWIEAVVPDAGTGQDSRVLLQDQPEDRFQIVPEDQIVLRFCSVIRDKHCKYLLYLNKKFVSANEPFLIAVNGAGIPIQFWDSGLPYEVPHAIKAVLPIGNYTVTIDRRSKEIVKEGFEYRKYLVKISGSPVPTNIFLDSNFAWISALLFSNAHPFFYDSASLSIVSLLHNYLALNALPKGWLGSGLEWWLEEKEEEYLLQRRVIPST